LIEDGRITLDQRVLLPRPRQRGSAAFAALEDRVLRHVMRQPANESPAPFGDHSLVTSIAQVRWAT
jgi:sulfonate transport system ATP-binding protein